MNTTENKPLQVLELFAGIGACSSALTRLGIEYEIVDAVEIDRFAIKSFNAIHGTNFEPQDITKWDKNIDVDLIMHGSPCFAAGTKVITSKGYKNIEDIKVGDIVLTHKNRFKEVTDIGSDGKKNIYKIETQGTLAIECTDNHPFLIKHKSKVWNNETKRYEFKFNKPEKVRLYNLKVNEDYIGIPILENIESDYSKLDEETLWLLGRYVADGHIDTITNKCVILSIGKDKKSHFENIKTYHKTYLHTKSCYRVVFNSSSNIYKIISGGVFGISALNKKIPIEILQLPQEKLKIFLEGYMSGDGCNIKKTSVYQATTISRELAESLVLAIQKVYRVGCRIYYTKRPKKYIIEERVVNQNDTYMIRFDLNPRLPRYLVEDNCIWYPIKKIIDTKHTKTIYNITVDDDHSYTANNCFSFNCQDFSVAGKQAGGDKDSGTRSSLMYETIRIVTKLKPKYVIWENVKNILSKKHIHNFEAYLRAMEELGYKNYYQVLNAKDYGVPQNRERVFTVSILNDKDFDFPETEICENKVINPLKNKSGYGWHFEQQVYDADGITRAIKAGEGSGNIPKVIIDFKFPEKQELTKRLKDILEETVDEKYYLKAEQIARIKNSNFMQEKTRIQENECCGTLLARDWKDPKCVRIGGIEACEGDNDNMGVVTTYSPYVNKKYKKFYDKNGYIPKYFNPYNTTELKDVAPTLTAQGDSITKSGTVLKKENNLRIRKLTPKECWRLMGFKDEEFEKAAKLNSNTQLYKQARKFYCG